MSVAAGIAQPLYAFRRVEIDQGVNSGRYQNTADCGDAGKRHLRWRRQFADAEFAFDFQPHEEKENGHEAIVDPQQERFRDFKVPELDGNRNVEKRGIRTHQSGIGQRHGKNRGGNQHEPAGGFHLEEVIDCFG